MLKESGEHLEKRNKSLLVVLIGENVLLAESHQIGGWLVVSLWQTESHLPTVPALPQSTRTLVKPDKPSVQPIKMPPYSSPLFHSSGLAVSLDPLHGTKLG
jgi:hypothetical protein